MILEGVVTNVTHFGAFVDLGVKEDGLVHISQLADHFVDDPSKVVKVGQKLKVRVLEIDLDRCRIALSTAPMTVRVGRGEAPSGNRGSVKRAATSATEEAVAVGRSRTLRAETSELWQ